MNNLLVVSPFEARLLRLLHFVLRRGCSVLLHRPNPLPQPPCLSCAAVELVQDTLARGCVRILTQGSCGRYMRDMQDGRVVEGRLWQRHAVGELALSFSAYTLESSIPADPAYSRTRKSAGRHRSNRRSAINCFCTLCTAPCAMSPARTWKKTLFRRHAVVCLAHAADFEGFALDQTLDFSPWVAGTGGALESLQGELSDCWRRAEENKREITDWQLPQVFGQARANPAWLFRVRGTGGAAQPGPFLPPVPSTASEPARPERWMARLRDTGPRPGRPHRHPRSGAGAAPSAR